MPILYKALFKTLIAFLLVGNSNHKTIDYAYKIDVICMCIENDIYMLENKIDSIIASRKIIIDTTTDTLGLLILNNLNAMPNAVNLEANISANPDDR